jgi:hypothetical protein
MEDHARIVDSEKDIETLEKSMLEIQMNVKALGQALDELTEMVKRHDRAMYGNNGDIGMCSQVREMAYKQNSMSDRLQELNDIFRGTGEQIGLIAKIQTATRTIEDWSDNQRWLTKLVIGAFATGIVGILMTYFK